MKYLITLTLFLYFSYSFGFSLFSTQTTPAWAYQMNKSVRALEKDFDGEFGVYVLDLESNRHFSYNSTQFWYLSSTIKVPVAIALLKLVDEKSLDLSEKVVINTSDYRDGAGPVNWIEPGNKVSYKYLLDQMLIYSDNAATDLIIKRVGLENINKMVWEHTSKENFGEITTLLDVRKKAYSEFHPEAEKLTNLDFLAIKKKKHPEKKLNHLATLLKVDRKDFKHKDLTAGFAKYYEKHWNSAKLGSYANLLKLLVDGKLLSEKSTQKLIKIMSGIHTGKKRIRKGLSRKSFFAHKTGTQHKQACDVGIAGSRKDKKPKILVLVCTRNWKKLSHAEKLMAEIGRIISKSGPLRPPK